jgi:MGT family glycosyltransferase
MRTVFFNVLGSGHVNPTLPIVKALAGRGDEVTYFSYPQRRAELEANGAVFHNYGDDDFTVARYHPKGFFPTQVVPAAAGLMPYLLQEVKRLAPDLIVSDSMAPWGVAVAKVLGIPAIGSISTFAFGRETVRRLGASSGLVVDEVNVQAMETLRREYDVDIRTEDLGGYYAPVNLVYTCSSFNPPVDDRPERMEFVGPMIARAEASSDASLEEFARSGKKRLYVSMGTVVGKMFNLGPDFYRPFFEAFGDREDHRVIVSVTDGIAPESLVAPANFSIRRWVPQLELLPHVDAFVTHGGMNSANEAMYNGVPVVALPFFGDQPIVAGQVAAHGAGIVLDPHALDAKSLLVAVERLVTEPSFREAAGKISADMKRTGGVVRALEVIDEVVRAGA